MVAVKATSSRSSLYLVVPEKVSKLCDLRVVMVYVCGKICKVIARWLLFIG